MNTASSNLVLTIDTTHPKEVTISLKQDNQVVVSQTDHNQFGSQILLPLIIKVLAEKKLKLTDLTAIEVNPGPGSFTGIRVGAAVAQALGQILKIPVNGSTSLPLDLHYS